MDACPYYSDLDDKTFLITGVAPGNIGEAICNALLATNARIVAQIRYKDVEQVALRLQLDVSASQLVVYDYDPLVARPDWYYEDGEHLFDILRERVASMGIADNGIAGLVNCIGSVSLQQAKRLEHRQIWTETQLNYLLPFVLMKQFYKYHLCYPQTQRAIVNITSIGAQKAFSGYCAYNAAKAALEIASRTCAREWADNDAGMRVNCIAPGPVEGPLQDHLISQAAWQSSCDEVTTRMKMTERIPQWRFAQAEDIAAAVVFLLSSVSRHITGATLRIDGGQLT